MGWGHRVDLGRGLGDGARTGGKTLRSSASPEALRSPDEVRHCKFTRALFYGFVELQHPRGMVKPSSGARSPQAVASARPGGS